jgi:Zn-dependent protease with chaperone function
MNDESFDMLVAGLTQKAKSHPTLFLWRTGALATLGYAFILTVFGLALTLTLGIIALIVVAPSFVTIKIGLVIGVVTGGMSWAILKAAWIRLQAPTGLKLTAKNAPELMQLIDSLRSKLKSARFHHVLLTGDYNASVCQIPLLGMFGWHRNYLSLGLPLMQSLSAAEFEGVLAHECAHLAGGHGRFGNWLYRMRRTWEQLIHQLVRQQNGGGRVFNSFLQWFWPRFNAHAFVLSRANEYEADATAARCAGAGPMAAALTRISVYGRHLDEGFWRPILRRANEEPAPPANIYAEMPGILSRGPESGLMSKWLHQAFLVKTDNTDTHPCLRERLEALGQLPATGDPDELPPLTGPSAADTYLGSYHAVHAAVLGKEWADHVRIRWQQRHTESKELADQLQESGGAAATGPAPVDVLWKKAEMVMNLEGPGAAQELIDEILVRDLSHADALFARGSWRLSQDDAAGLRDVERAMELDRDWTGNGLDQLASYYHRHGQVQELKALRLRFEAFEATQWEARAERAGVELNDALKAHGLTPAMEEALRNALAAEPAISKAWCAQKIMRHHPKSLMHVLAVEVKVPFWKLRLDGANQKLVQRLLAHMPFPNHYVVFVRKGELVHLADKISRMPGAQVYQRAAK